MIFIAISNMELKLKLIKLMANDFVMFALF